MKELLFFKLDQGVYPIFIYPQYCISFICAEKKQKDKQTNRQTKKGKKKKISWIRGFIQFLCIPNIAEFSLVQKEKKKQEDNQVDKQTNKEYLTLDCPTKTESARAWRAFLDREEGLFLSKKKQNFF